MSSSADDILFSNIQGGFVTQTQKTVHNFKFISRDDYEDDADLDWTENASGQMVLLWNNVEYHGIADDSGMIEDTDNEYTDVQTFVDWHSCDDDLCPVASLLDSEAAIWNSKKYHMFFIVQEFGSGPIRRILDMVAYLESCR